MLESRLLAEPIDHRFLGLNRRWNKKWMELHPHLIVWYREPRSVPRGYIMLAPTTTVGEEAGKGSSIEVTSSSRRKLRFRSKDTAGHYAWLADLSAVLMERRRELANAPPASTAPSLAGRPYTQQVDHAHAMHAAAYGGASSDRLSEAVGDLGAGRDESSRRSSVSSMASSAS